MKDGKITKEWLDSFIKYQDQLEELINTNKNNEEEAAEELTNDTDKPIGEPVSHT